ncbi:MAG: PIN domain-containing protein [Promethearchaeia archaeon]
MNEKDLRASSLLEQYNFLKRFDNIIIIDANFILLPFQFKIDYFNEINYLLEGSKVFILFQQIVDELNAKKLRESNSEKFLRQLDSGISYLNKMKNKFNVININLIKEENETTDDFLIKKCKEFRGNFNRVYLATNDSKLRKKAKKSNINVIFLRQRKFLSLE